MTHPLDQFEAIYVINLASRADRRAEMQEQLQRIGLSLQSLSIQLFEAVRPADAGGFPSVGARGCFHSHLGVLQHALAAGVERVLIVEDDLNFADDFLQRGAAVLEQLSQKDWAVFYGGYELASSVVLPSGCSLLSPDEPVRTTHFIAFRGAAIGEAAAYLSAMRDRPPGHVDGGPMHVDGAYTWLRRAHPQWQTWAAAPPLGHQRASRTDIHDLRWHDRLPVVRDAVAMLRRLKNR